MSIQQAAQRLQYLCNTIPPLLHNVSEAEFSKKPAPTKWSKRQILGHLIDSAANNHQRFVRVQFEHMPAISYDQDLWNSYSYHEHIQTSDLIMMWTAYNKYLLEVIKRIPSPLLSNSCITNGAEPVSLAFVINDYVTHLEHHLHQIVFYH